MSLTWEVVEMFEVQTYNGSLVVQSCISCGTMFGVERGLENQLRLTHQGFYCPNGHGQRYQAKTDAERLRDQLAAVQSDRDQIAARLRDAQAEALRVNARAAAGVCPCCTRTFQNIARHLKTKHPEFAAKARAHPPKAKSKSKPRTKS